MFLKFPGKYCLIFVCLFVFGRTLSFKALLKQMVLDWDQIRFLGNCPPLTPPLSQPTLPQREVSVNVSLGGGVGGQFPRNLNWSVDCLFGWSTLYFDWCVYQLIVFFFSVVQRFNEKEANRPKWQRKDRLCYQRTWWEEKWSIEKRLEES